MLILNQEQLKGLANFFFDLAKGLILGGVGFSLTIPFVARTLLIFFVLFTAVWFVKIALDLLEEVK